MKTVIETDNLWGKVRELNEKSHIYSEMADELTKLIKQLENN